MTDINNKNDPKNKQRLGIVSETILLEGLNEFHGTNLTLNVEVEWLQGYMYPKLRKTFSKFYRRHYDLISKFQIGLKSLLR